MAQPSPTCENADDAGSGPVTRGTRDLIKLTEGGAPDPEATTQPATLTSA